MTLKYTPAQVVECLQGLTGWKASENFTHIHKTFLFKDYYRTMAFVNAVAFVAHAHNHHPDLLVRYNDCVVTYQTHTVHGLSENDFMCAAKIDALLI